MKSQCHPILIPWNGLNHHFLDAWGRRSFQELRVRRAARVTPSHAAAGKVLRRPSARAVMESVSPLVVWQFYGCICIYIYIYMGKLQYNDLTVTEAWNHEFMGNHPQPDDKMWGLISSSGTNYNHPQGRNVFPGGDRWCLIHISSFSHFSIFFGGCYIYI